MGLEEKYWLKDAFKTAKESMDEISAISKGPCESNKIRELIKKFEGINS